MNHSKAEEDLRVITGLLRDWSHSRRISGLEYDLLLDKLKELYEIVRFADIADGGAGSEAATGPEPVAAAEPKPAPVAEEERQPACPSEPEQPAACREPEPAIRENPVHRKTVRALYDDERPFSEDDAADALRMMSDAVGAVCCASEQRRAVAEQSQYGADAAESGESMVRSAILGETIGHAGPTVADRLQASGRRTTADVCRGHAASLREMIGLNDRYLLMNELFGGDRSAYEEAIGRLDEMTTIEDALIWLHDRYRWNGESEAAQLLSELLTRKLM